MIVLPVGSVCNGGFVSVTFVSVSFGRQLFCAFDTVGSDDTVFVAEMVAVTVIVVVSVIVAVVLVTDVITVNGSISEG